MIKNAKLLAFDLDGTLLGDDKKVGSRTAAGIKTAISNGIHVVLASGRMCFSVIRYARELGIPADTPVISYNGALVKTVAGKTIYERSVPIELAQDLIDYTAENHWHLNFYYNDELYMRERDQWAELYLQRFKTAPHFIHDFSPLKKLCPTKLVIIDTIEKTNALQIPMRQRYAGSLYITKTDEEYLEFMNPLATKGCALESVAEYLEIPRDQVVSFGDSFNDIPMLEWAGWSVAMGNAKDEVKAHACQIAPSVDEDGVGQLLEDAFGLVA
jgi:Cof subfamily protein (haloacid dehalogenase superfamily)